MKPGDLVTLKYHTWYEGIDTVTGSFFRIPGGSIGVLIHGDDRSNNQIVLTNNRMMACVQGVWIGFNEAR